MTELILIVPIIYWATIASGGQAGADKLGRFGFLPEVIFGLAVAYPLWGSMWYALCIVSYLGITTGLYVIHASRFGARPERVTDRMNKIDYLLTWLKPRGSVWYCRAFCFIKGTIACAPLLWLAPVGGLCWSFAYEYGFSKEKGSRLAERVCGILTGILVSATLLI